MCIRDSSSKPIEDRPFCFFETSFSCAEGLSDWPLGSCFCQPNEGSPSGTGSLVVGRRGLEACKADLGSTALSQLLGVGELGSARNAFYLFLLKTFWFAF